MKLSVETLNILKNFSTINQNLEFKAGNKISTISPTKSVLAEATLKDEFPESFCVYDLNQFLSVHSLFKEGAEINFDKSNIILQHGRSKIKYRKTERKLIVTPPDKSLKLGSADCSFQLTAADYEWIQRTANVLSSPNIKIESDGEHISIASFDSKDDSAHTNSLDIAEGDGKHYKIVFKTENIKMIPGTYDVQINFDGLSLFKNVNEEIQYWIAIESKESEVD